MRVPLRSAAVAAASVAALLAVAPTAGADSTGGCPSGADWTLTSLEDLGFPPGEATGIPSLDGNGDGFTCVKPFTVGKNSGGVVFRDNTVQGS